MSQTRQVRQGNNPSISDLGVISQVQAPQGRHKEDCIIRDHVILKHSQARQVLQTGEPSIGDLIVPPQIQAHQGRHKGDCIICDNSVGI